MKYTLEIVSILLLNGPVKLYVPAIAAVKRLYEAGGVDKFPYWAALWPSAMALSVYLQQFPHLVKGKRVLEIAAGLGLPSLVAARFAQTVYCTDLDTDAITIAMESAKLAGVSNIHFASVDWNEIPVEMAADVVLLSDVNYESEAFPSLLRLIMRFLQQGATILLATPQRLMAKPFIDALLTYCKHREMLEGKSPDGRSAEIMIYRLSDG